MGMSARDNLPRQCPACRAEFLRVTDEDDIAAVGEYLCGEKRMAFRDGRKSKVVIREGRHGRRPFGKTIQHMKEKEEEDRSKEDLFYT